jgi:hypothetical protein
LTSCICDQGELAHDERLAADVLDAQVEATFVVLEDPKPRHAGGEATRLLLPVVRRDADESAEAGFDLADRFVADDDARAPHALDDRPH